MWTLSRVLHCTDVLVVAAVALLVLWSRYYALLTCAWTGPASNITRLLWHALLLSQLSPNSQ